MKNIDKFFAYARERHAITLRRAAGMPREEWTDNKILQTYRFTCVFRELDKTTAWFRKFVRDPMRSKPEVLLATVVFRLLNRIEVGEAIFNQLDIEGTPFALFEKTGKTAHLKRAIVANCGRGPYVTGAYIISSPPGYSKLDGMMKVIGDFYGCLDREPLVWAQDMIRKNAKGKATLQEAWEYLKEFDYFGPFHAYEIVTDLRHTKLLGRAPDIMTWANPGPGARRGANIVFGRDKKDKTTADREQLIDEMRQILEASKRVQFWPHHKDYPKWELRDVEHTLCEFDKYTRVKNGEGRPRGVYR